MADPGHARPGSSAATSHHERDPVPSSPRPSVASRASRSSLRRDRPDTSSGPPRPPSPTADPHPQPSPPAADPEFTPLFTLITSNTHPAPRHPVTSYIFADDDPELLTDALFQNHNASERAVLVDLVPAASGPGYDVVRASSLAPDWAVVSASVVGGRRHGDLMLQIEGVSVDAGGGKVATPPAGEGGEQLQLSGGSGEKAGQRQAVGEEYTALLGDFENRMGVLRRVVDAGGGSAGGSEGEYGGEGRDEVPRRDSGDGAASSSR